MAGFMIPDVPRSAWSLQIWGLKKRVNEEASGADADSNLNTPHSEAVNVPHAGLASFPWSVGTGWGCVAIVPGHLRDRRQ